MAEAEAGSVTSGWLPRLSQHQVKSDWAGAGRWGRLTEPGHIPTLTRGKDQTETGWVRRAVAKSSV